MRRRPLRVVLPWLALLLLAALNVALDRFGLAANLGVAVTMALVLLVVFMELGRGASLLGVFAGACFFWIAILFGLTAADYVARFGFPPT
jgi:caa(3)-type oxidase subunit IV